MKATELRIGNWVLSPTEGEIQIENGWQIDEGEEVEPIPLTEEWLVKFGFEKEDRYFDIKINNFWLTYDYREAEYSISENKLNYSDIWIELNHVHSLQNLYFALTGEELNQNKEDE